MINFNDVAAQWREIENETLPDVLEVLRNGPYILGKKVLELETKFTHITWVPYALGVSSGTDALKLAVQVAIKKTNPLVLVQANAHISDALAGAVEGTELRFVDCDEYYNIDVDGLHHLKGYEFIVIVTHMYGQTGNIREILRLFPGAVIIEDCSQAFGATSIGKPVGSFGAIGCYSLYPTKNLGAIGDAGMIVTNNQNYYEQMKLLREYGQKDKLDCIDWGGNYRLDELQATILLHKIDKVQEWIEKKRLIASHYLSLLSTIDEIVPPKQAPYADKNTWHIFPIRTKHRDALKEHLRKNGIPTLIHYPIPLNKTTLFNGTTHDCPRTNAYAKELLSLPIHPYMKQEDVITVVDAIKGFFVS